MRFEDAYEGWTSMRLTQIDAAQLLGGCRALFTAPLRLRAGQEALTDTRKTAWTG